MINRAECSNGIWVLTCHSCRPIWPPNTLLSFCAANTRFYGYRIAQNVFLTYPSFIKFKYLDLYSCFQDCIAMSVTGQIRPHSIVRAVCTLGSWDRSILPIKITYHNNHLSLVSRLGIWPNTVSRSNVPLAPLIRWHVFAIFLPCVGKHVLNKHCFLLIFPERSIND